MHPDYVKLFKKMLDKNAPAEAYAVFSNIMGTAPMPETASKFVTNKPTIQNEASKKSIYKYETDFYYGYLTRPNNKKLPYGLVCYNIKDRKWMITTEKLSEKEKLLIKNHVDSKMNKDGTLKESQFKSIKGGRGGFYKSNEKMGTGEITLKYVSRTHYWGYSSHILKNDLSNESCASFCKESGVMSPRNSAICNDSVFKNIKEHNQQMGRLAEIFFGLKNPEFYPHNKDFETGKNMDYSHNNISYDVKAIVERTHRLLVDEDSIKKDDIADVFPLYYVSKNKAGNFIIEYHGYALKKDIMESYKENQCTIKFGEKSLYPVDNFYLKYQ